MSATFSSLPPPDITPSWRTAKGVDEQFGKMGKGTSINLYIITFICVVFVLLTIVIIIFAERRRRQAREVVGMMMRHANEYDAAMREKKPVMRDVERLDEEGYGRWGETERKGKRGRGVGWGVVYPLAVQAILPISTKDISNTKPTPPSHSSSAPHENQTQTQLIPRPRLSRFNWRHFFTLDPLPTDPYGPHPHHTNTAYPHLHPHSPYAPPAIITEPNLNMDKKTRDLYVKKAEAFQVTMLIAMPSPRRERERWGSRSSSGSGSGEDSSGGGGESSSSGGGGDVGEGSSGASGSESESGGSSGDVVRWRAGDDEPVTIPPFTLGVARVDHKYG